MSKNKFFSLVFILYAWLASGSAIAADWSAAFNGKSGGTYVVNASTVDASGNIYLAGNATTNIAMGSSEVARIGTQDTFVVKLDAAGNVVWLKNFGGNGASAYAYGIAVDGAGNVYLGGRFLGANLTTPALIKIGGSDAFAVKLDSSGNTIWAKNFGGAGATVFGNGIAVDGSSGTVYLGGSFSGADLTTPALSRIGTGTAFAIKLDSSGNTNWAKNFGGAGGSANVDSIAVDGSSGSVYLGGSFSLANLTTPALTKIGPADALAIKLDSSGNIAWAKNFGGVGASTRARSITLDGPGGNVYLAGDFSAGNPTDPAMTKIGTYDAFAIKLDSSGNTIWAKNFGGVGASANGYSIAVDGSGGNVYLGGYFNGANLTTPAMTKIGTYDAFAIKLDSSGNTIWAKNFGGAGASAYGKGIAVAGSGGNVYLGGSFVGANLTTPALAKIGTYDPFVLKLDYSGNTTLSLNPSSLAAGERVSVTSSAVDGAGNVYTSGYFNSTTFTLGSTTLTRFGSTDAFVAKSDSSGTVIWAKNFGGVGAQVYGNSIAVDSSGNVYLSGYFKDAHLTTPALTKIGTVDAIALKLDSSGNITPSGWAKNFGDVGAEVYGNGIAVDGTGNVYLGGNFSFASLTTLALSKLGTQDAFAIKLDSSGATSWAKNFGGSGANTVGNDIAVDGTGNVYLGGYFQNANLTTPALTLFGNGDAFAFKLNSAGATTWYKNFGGSGGNAYGNSIAVDGVGNVYLGGQFSATNLTTPALTKIGDVDAFALKLDSSGGGAWAKNFGGSGATTIGTSIAVDGAGNVYLGGYASVASLTTPTLTKIGIEDAFVFKLDSSGNSTWSANYGGSGASARGLGIAADSAGNFYLGGYFSGASLTTPALTKTALQHGLLLKRATVAAVAGACGSANATTPLVTSAPSANLCTTGSASSVTASNSAYTWSCTGTTTDSCSASRGYTVTPSAGSNGNISPNTAQVVAFNATTGFTAAPASGYAVNSWGGSCGGTASGTGNVNYSTSAVTADCGVSVSFTGSNSTCGSSANVVTAFLPTANLCGAGTASTVTPGTSNWAWICTGTGAGATNATCSAPYPPVNGGGGTVGAIQTQSTNGWQIDQVLSGFVALPAPAPAGVTFPIGATKVVLITGTAGTSSTVTLRFSSIAAGAQLYKYGKENGIGDTNKWFAYPATIDVGAGTVTYTLTDGQKGDNDWTENSVIDDPVAFGVGGGAVASIPTLSEWGMRLLTGLIALATFVTLRRRNA